MEAIQFHEWGPWHAVRPDAKRTVCGRNPITAKRMWEKWADKGDRCFVCEQILNRKK